jgi:glycine/D-amino acid oxidase-like deaminating enzyme
MTTTEVVIIGAGAVGCSTAYFLAREGAKVTIIERDSVASHASGSAAGLLLPLSATEGRETLWPIVELSFRMHRDIGPRLEEESGVKLRSSMSSMLKVCLEQWEVDEAREVMEAQKDFEGFTSVWLDGDEVRHIEPRLTEDVLGGCLAGPIGMVDAYSYTLALAQAAERYGAVMRHGNVTGMHTAGDRVRAVRVGQEDVACDVCVIAMGPWTGAAGEWMQTPVPVRPYKGETVCLQGIVPKLSCSIKWRSSITQKPDDLLWVGSTREHVGFDDSVTTDARDQLMGNAARLMPAMMDVPIVRQVACFRPLTPDTLPIIDGECGVDGVYIASGSGGHGILLSPAMGKAVADLVTGGATDVPVEPYRLDRFGGVMPDTWGDSI